MTTDLSPMEDKFIVYVQKSCNPGPYLDGTKVANLPDFFQAKSVCQTITNVIEAVVLAGANFKETFDKIPAYFGHGSGTDIDITENGKDGKRRKHYYKLPVMDRKSKGEVVLEKFVGNLKCCTKFLLSNQRTCKECHLKQEEQTPLKVEPTTELSKKEPTLSSPEMSKPKAQFTVYCRRNCKVGPLLDPEKVQKLPTSFSGSLPKIIQKLVPVLVLSGYNPSDAIKHVPSSQGRCILVKIKIGKSDQMCLVHNISSTVKFWCFLKKLRLAFGMCENFFSEKPPKKSSCKKCRNTDIGAGYFISDDDDDDFQDLKGFKEQTGKRKRSTIDEPTSVKKSKSSHAIESSRFHCKELKVVIRKLPLDIVNNYLQRDNLPRTPTRKRVKQVYLHGKKVNLFIPALEKSPQKNLFPEALNLLLSPSKGKDGEAENLLNIRETQETTQAESGKTTAEEISIEKADDDNYLLETFLNEGIEDNNPELMVLKEMGEKLEERNPLQGLFEKSEEQQDSDKSNEEELQDEERFQVYSSLNDALQLFSPDSFFGDEGSTEMNEVSSSPNRTAEMDRNKREQQDSVKSPCKEKELRDKTSASKKNTGSNSSSKVCTEISETHQEGKIISEWKQADEGNAVIPDRSSVPHADPLSSTLDVISSERRELKGDEGSGSITGEPPILSIALTSKTITTHEGPPKVDFQNSSHCFTTDTESTGKAVIDAPLPHRKAKEDQLPPETRDYTASENLECNNSSASSVPPLSSQNSEHLNLPTASQSNTFASLSFPEVLQTLELAAKESAQNSISASLSQEALGRKELNYTNTAVQQLHSVATPQLQSLSVQNFRMTSLTGKFGPPEIPRPLDNLLGPSTQGPLQSLPGNVVVSNPGFPVTNGTYGAYGTPMVSLPGNHVSNTPLPPGLQPVTGNFSNYSSHPVYHGTNNVLSNDFLFNSLPGPYTNTSSLRNFSNGYMKAAPQLVHNARQQATQSFRQPRPRPQLQPFTIPHTNVGLCSPYQSITNSLMLPVATSSHPSTTGIPAGSNPVFVKAALLNNQPYFLTNQPSRELLFARQHPSATSQSVPVSTNLLPVEIPTASHYQPLATGKPTSHSVPSTNPSTIGAPVHYPPLASSLLASPTPVVPPTARHHIPSIQTKHPISQSLQSPNPSVKAPTTSCYPPSATGQPISQSFTGTSLSSVEVPTTSHYPPSATGQPISQNFVGTNPSSVKVSTTIGQASQSLPPMTSQPQGSLNVVTSFAAVSPIQNQTIPKSNIIPIDSVVCHNNNVGEDETTSEPNNNDTDTITCNDVNVADFETTTGAKNPPPQNPLAKTTLHFLCRCEILSTEARLHIRNKLVEMLRKRRQRLAITQKDINDLEELVGAEIKNDTVFQDLIKLIIAEPVLSSENSMSGGDDSITIMDQPSEKSSIPTSESSMVNNQPENNAASHVVVGRKFNPSLPKPGVRVTKIQGMTILLWDIPDYYDVKLIKEYELYAIQLEAKQKLTKDLIKSMTWRKIGNVKALSPPMAITLTNLVQGFKNYMIVRGVGNDGRAGPFSYICEVLES